ERKNVMRTIRALLTSATFLFAAFFAVSTGAGQQSADQHDHNPAIHHHGHDHDTAADPSHENVAEAAHEHGHHDHGHLALLDIAAYAAIHLDGIPVAESFGAIDDWTHDWQLRWVDYNHGDETIRIYHAT